MGFTFSFCVIPVKIKLEFVQRNAQYLKMSQCTLCQFVVCFDWENKAGNYVAIIKNIFLQLFEDKNCIYIFLIASVTAKIDGG